MDLEALVPEDHLLRKIERVIDYEWLYALLSPYYCHDNGRPGIDPVVLIKMVLIQHLFGIASLRQTYREILVNNAYRWFLGYGLLEQIPYFATVSCAGRSTRSAKSWGKSRLGTTKTTAIRRLPAAEKRQKRQSRKAIRPSLQSVEKPGCPLCGDRVSRQTETQR